MMFLFSPFFSSIFPPLHQAYSSAKRCLCIMMQKFLDSSKLKRHFLIHTGERDFVCPHEGCGKVIILFYVPPNPFHTVQHEIGYLSSCHSSYRFMTLKLCSELKT